MNNIPPEAIRLIQITDLHCYADDNAKLEWSDIPVYPNRSVLRVLAHLQNENTSFDALVISGDLVQEETAASYQRISEMLQDFPKPIYVLPGNHDIPALMKSHLVEQDENVHFQLKQDFGQWQCLFLDTNAPQSPEGHLDDEQFADIAAQLSQLSPEDHVLLFMHHHPLSIGSPWMDKMGLQETEQFWSLLARYPQVSCVVFGHIHSEFSVEHAINDKHIVDVFGTPATCIQVKHIDENLNLDHARPAWRELTLYPDGKLDTEVKYLPEAAV